MTIRPVGGRPQAWWYGLMAAGGIAFGLIGERRPLGSDVLAHPFVLFFIVVAIGLIVLRIARARPVPELIPERTLLIGCLVGGAAFLVGSWIATHVVALLASSSARLF
jgi:hypothetical protein